MKSMQLPFLLLCLTTLGAAQNIQGRDGIRLPAPPAAAAEPVDDEYFGQHVVDSFRWLENAKSAQTESFIDAQNAYTERYLKQARAHLNAADDLESLVSVSRWSLPVARGSNLFFWKRLAGEEQGSIYIRRGGAAPLSAKAAPKDERLVDPAKLSRDPNTSVDLADVTRDGSLLAYFQREGGADETTAHFYNVKTGKVLEDTLDSAQYFSVAFTPDGKGVYYTRQTRQGALLFQHNFGERMSRDVLLFGREFHGMPLGPQDLFSAYVSDDGRYLIVTIPRGVPARRVDIVFRDLTKPGTPFQDLIWGVDARFEAQWVHTSGPGEWIVLTDYKAPNSRILRANPGILPDSWDPIVPENTTPIEDLSIVGGKLYVSRLQDVLTRTNIFSLTGKPLGELNYDGVGSVSGLGGQTTDRYAYFSFESFLVPPSVYRLDTQTGQRTVFAQPRLNFDASQYELKQLFYPSKDGTRVPIFVAGRKDLKRDGSERLLMTGYGGFKVSMTPYWNPMFAWWLQQGGWFALPNLRGGGEYGEHWHEQGMFEHKQNVFDDWFAAAEFLIREKYTSPAHFAITGRSNGGLLMGASMTQRPELFSAIVCGYPLLDMLRYQRFLQGPQWVTEYGSTEKSAQFNYLLKYSPYQNVHPDAPFPSILFFTGESDTRVDPLHARKMTALLQSVSKSGRPILLHDSRSGGHSAGVGVSQQIQDDADQLTFLWTESGAATASK